MKQRAEIRPIPSLQRQAAIAFGGATDHAASVRVEPITGFDLNRTIFNTLEGAAARFVMRTRVAKQVYWQEETALRVQQAYESTSSSNPLPEIDEALMSEVEWQHTQAFPSILRLLYGQALREELRNNLNRTDELESVRFHRVIDNEEIVMSGEEFWVHLNYHLIHLIDFLPVANWSVQVNDTSFILFRSLLDIFEQNGRLEVQLHYQPASKRKSLLPGGTGEDQSLPAWLTTLIPVGTSERMAASSIKRFSDRIGHSLSYEMQWGA